MVEVSSFSAWFINNYNLLNSSLPLWAQNFLMLFALALIIMLYSIFIWKFYRFVATKNILELNLNQYNKSEHPVFAKLFAGVLYLIEYIIVLPFIIFFWFTIFTLFLIFLTENIEVSNLLIISATIIAAIRLTSYIPNYGQELAKEIAKLLPFTLLAVSVLNPKFFSIERVINNLSQLPNFFEKIIAYLTFIILLEITLRIFDFVFSLFGLGGEE